MKEQQKIYVLFCLCLFVSCLCLYALPENFWVHFNIRVSQLNIDSIETERFDALKNKYLPQGVDCLAQAQSGFYACSFQTQKKSMQTDFLQLLQKNKEHGYLNRDQFLNLIEEKLNSLKLYRQDNVNLELKMVALDEKLDEADLQTALSWQDTLYNLNTELKFNQQRLSFFTHLKTDSEQEKKTYQDKIATLEQTIEKLREDLVLHEKQKTVFSETQNQYLEIKQQLNENTLKIDELRRRSSFLEQILIDYASQSTVPDPDQIQWRITQVAQKTQRYAFAKMIYVIPFAFLFFALCLWSREQWMKKTNLHELDEMAISKILNVPFLGDLNSFFSKKNDTEKS